MNGESDYILLSEAAKLSGYSVEHIRRLCISGKIRGHRSGNLWVTTAEEINRFVEESKSLAPTSATQTSPSPSLKGGEYLKAAVLLTAAFVIFLPAIATLTGFDVKLQSWVDTAKRSVATLEDIRTMMESGSIAEESLSVIPSEDVSPNRGIPQQRDPSTSVGMTDEANELISSPQVLGISNDEVIAAMRAVLSEGLPQDILSQLKGEKGDKGDAGLTVGFTTPTSTNPGSYGGYTFNSAKSFSAESLTVSSDTTLKTISVTGSLTSSGQIIATKVPATAHVFAPSWPTGTSGASDASIYVNPSSATADSNLIGAAINGTVKFLVDAEGDIYGNNLILSGSTTTGATTIAGNLTVQDSATLGDATTDLATVTGALRLGNLTTAQRDALTPTAGYTIYNTTTSKMQVYTSSWKNVGNPEIGAEVTSGTSGSILFVDSSGNLAQDNSKLFWDNANDRLGVGTASPSVTLDISGNLRVMNQSEIRFGDADSSNYVGFKSPTTVGSNVVWTLPSADASGCFKSNGAGLISIDSCSASAVSAGGLTNDFRGLQLRTATDGDALKKVTLVHADEIVTKDGTRHTPANNLHADITVSGIGGLRAGQTEAASTWYKIMFAYGSSGSGIYLEQAKDYFKDEEQTTVVGNNAANNADSTTEFLAQGFRVDTAGIMEFIDVSLQRAGTVSGRIWWTLESDSGGNPTGTVLATSDKLDASLVSTSNQWVRIVFRSPATLSAATTYHLRMRSDYTQSTLNNIRWNGDTANSYANGQAKRWDGSAWQTSGNSQFFGVGNNNNDFAFKIYVTRNDNTPTPPSGYNTSYAHIGYVYNDSGSNFQPFTAQGRSVRMWKADGSPSHTGPVSSTVSLLQDISTYVPPVPVRISLSGYIDTNGADLQVFGVPDGYGPVSSFGTGGVTIQNTSTTNTLITAVGTIFTEYQGWYVKVSGGSGYPYHTSYEWSTSNIGTPAGAGGTQVWLLNDTNEAYYTTANVGIGTGDPGASLDVYGTDGGTVMRVRSSATRGIDFVANGDTWEIDGTGGTPANNILTVGTQTGSIGIRAAPDTATLINIGGSFTGVGATRGLYFTTALTGIANTDIAGFRLAPTFVEAGSGTHGKIASIFMPATTVTAGAAAVTDTAQLYIEGPLSATVTGANYALWVDAGVSRFDGAITLGAAPATAGDLRFSNNAPIYARNAANTQDIEVINLDASNNLILAGSTGGAQAGAIYTDLDFVFRGNKAIRRNTSDGSDSGVIVIAGGGGAAADSGSTARGGDVAVYGNEHNGRPGKVDITLGQVAGSSFRVIGNGGATVYLGILESDGKTTFITSNGAAGAWELQNSHATTPFGIYVTFTAAAPNGTGNPFFRAADSGTERFTARSNGGLANFSANNVNLSDERMKNLFGDAPSELERFSQLKFVLGEYKDNPLEVKDVMLTAQQVQTVYPELVTVFSTETGTLGIREGALALRAYKAIQELNDKISNLSIDKIISIAGNWSIDENGDIVANSIKVEKGVTIKDQDTGEYYCLTIKSGVVVHVAGTCDEMSEPGSVAGENTEVNNDDNNNDDVNTEPPLVEEETPPAEESAPDPEPESEPQTEPIPEPEPTPEPEPVLEPEPQPEPVEEPAE